MCLTFIVCNAVFHERVMCMTKSAVLFLASCLLLACSQRTEMSHEKTPLLQESKVQTEKKKQIRMEKVSEIHLKEREKPYIGEISKISVSKNRLYLLNKTLKQILMYSMEGEIIRAIGRTGEGPGEFRYLYTMDVKDHLIACYDQGTRRITLFDTSGVFIRSFGTQTQMSIPSGNRVAITQHHTILHCQKPRRLPKDEWRSYSSPWLICELDTLGNVLSYYGEFDQEIVGDRLDRRLVEFEWSFPQFITTGESHTYLWFFNLPIVVRYDESNAVSRVFNVATPITKPRLIDKDAEKDAARLRHLSNKERARLDFETMKTEHVTISYFADIAYVAGHSLLLIMQTIDERRGISYWNYSHYLSAYDLTTGHRLMTDMPLQSEKPVLYQRIATDAEGFLYYIQNDQPDDFVIGKYEIVLEEI